MKMIIPIPASYKRAIERTDFHNPIFFIKGFHAVAICQYKKQEWIQYGILNHSIYVQKKETSSAAKKANL